jgi:hypothetical protein
MKRALFTLTVLSSALLCSFPAIAAEEQVFKWSCSEKKQFSTTGNTETVRLTWESKTFELKRENSLPGSLRYKNTDIGLDLVVLGNKAMLFNIRAGTRMADFCQTADMKTGKLPHLFAGAEPFEQQ